MGCPHLTKLVDSRSILLFISLKDKYSSTRVETLVFHCLGILMAIFRLSITQAIETVAARGIAP